MLKLALQYEDALIREFRRTWFNPKFYYYNSGCFYSEYEASADTIENHQFVSVTDWGDIIGYIGYSVDRAANVAYDLNIINFGDNKMVFGLDLAQAIDDIFIKFGFSKVEFSVVIGNPAEAMYDKFIKLCGGRVVGIYHDHTKLVDGQLHDSKLYELMGKNYIKNRNKLYKYTGGKNEDVSA